MALKIFKSDIDLSKNQLLNAVAQNLSTHPSTVGLPAGYFYYNTAQNTTYQWTGSVWLDLGAQGTGTVSSVGASISGALSVSGSPVTTTGTLAFTWTGTTAQYVRGDGSLQTFPTTTPAALTRTNDTNVTLTLGGTPNTALLQATSMTLGWTGILAISRGGTGLSSLGTANQLLRVNAGATSLEYFTPSYLTANQTITLSGDVTGTGTTAITTTIANDAVTFAKMQNIGTNRLLGRYSAGSGDPQEVGIDSTLQIVAGVLGVNTGSMGGGTVTSVALSLPSIFSVSGSPITTSGTLTGTLASQTAKYVFAAPNGSSGSPSFRLLLPSDLGTGTTSTSTYLRGDGTWVQLINDSTTTTSSTWSSDKITTYVQSNITGLMDLKGDYDASVNSPNLDSSPSAGTIFKGDSWVVSTAGTFYSEDVEVGDVLVAKINDPASLTDWIRLNKNIPPIATTTSYAASFGDGTSTSFTITHSLGSRDLIVQIYNTSTYEEVEMQVVRTSTSVITIDTNTAPTSNQYRVVIHRIV